MIFGINANVAPGTLSAGGGTYAGTITHRATIPWPAARPVMAVTSTARRSLCSNPSAGPLSRAYRRGGRSSDATTYDQDWGRCMSWTHGGLRRWSKYSEELHLSSLDGATIADHEIHWLAGLFVYKMNDGLRPLQIAGAAVGGIPFFGATSVSYTRSYAAFMDGTYAIEPATHLTLGIRYTDDRIKNEGNTNTVLPDGTGIVVAAPDQYADATKPTYRAILDHKITQDVMIYASVSSGFKSGGFALFSEGNAAGQAGNAASLCTGTEIGLARSAPAGQPRGLRLQL